MDENTAPAQEVEIPADLSTDLGTESSDLPTDDTESEGGTTDQAPEELFEIKVDGQIIKMTKDELLKEAQKSRAAGKRMQEAAKEKQDALRLIELAKKDPFALLKQLQPEMNEKDLLSKRLAALMEDELLTPQERQHRQDMLELQRYRQSMKDQEEQKQQEELNKLAAEQQQVLDKEIAEAISTVGLPKTKAAVKRVAEYMLDAIEAGLNVPVAKIAAQVKQDLQDEMMELLNQSDEDAFEQLLGKDLLTKAQKASLKQVKKPGNPVAPSAPRDKADKPKRETPEDFLRSQGIF